MDMDNMSFAIGIIIGAVVGIVVGLVIKDFIGNKLTDIARDGSGRIIEVHERYV